MSETSTTTKSAGSFGCLGPFIALFLSVKTWGWTGWAFLHFFCGWVYVAYWSIFHSGWVK